MTTATTPAVPLVCITRGVVGQARIPGVEVRVGPAAPGLGRAELLAFVRGAAAIGTMFDDRVDAQFLDAAGPGLRGVCNYAVGIDNIDLAECARRGVAVANTPDAVTEGTANIALGLILAVGRRIAEGDRFCRAGGFERQGNAFPTGWCGVHFTGQTLLIVGAGRIGRAVAMRGQALGMKIEYVARRRHLDFEQAPLAARWVELDEALPRADVVSLHTPLTPETRGLIGAARLAIMKPTAILINTSRGPVVDEAALVEALREQRLYGAGLDVFEAEPRIEPGLLTLDNVVLTPHIGSAETFWREQMTRMVCENLRAMATGGTAANLVG